MSDNMLWLQHFIDERIERALKPSGVIPNQVINGVTYDRFGRAVRAVASSGGSSLPRVVLWMHKANPSNISAGSNAHVNFDYTSGFDQGTLNTGSSWSWGPNSVGVFLVHVSVGINRGSVDFASGDTFAIDLYRQDLGLYASLDYIKIESTRSEPIKLQGSAIVYLTSSHYFWIRVTSGAASTHEVAGDGDGGADYRPDIRVLGSTRMQIIELDLGYTP